MHFMLSLDQSNRKASGNPLILLNHGQAPPDQSDGFPDPKYFCAGDPPVVVTCAALSCLGSPGRHVASCPTLPAEDSWRIEP